MYLSDSDLRGILSELRIEALAPTYPFVAEDQIQPCSIDLRLDVVFWRQQRKSVVDLRRSKLMELSPRRHWKKTVLRVGESVLLKPGQLLLGRTYEKFQIPNGYAGKLEGRSSFARMGLSVHCSADFINPGYRGHMPIQLVNFGESTIRVFPFLPICQLILVKLSSPADRVYGDRELFSKYMEDDGGPSYWWRDKRISQLHELLGEHDVSEGIQSEILTIMGPREPELIERFETLIRKLPGDELRNAEDVMDRFANAENSSFHLRQVIRGFRLGAAPILIACSIGSLFSQPFGWGTYGWLHYLLWALTLASIPLTLSGMRNDSEEFLRPRDLERIRQEISRRRSP